MTDKKTEAKDQKIEKDTKSTKKSYYSKKKKKSF